LGSHQLPRTIEGFVSEAEFANQLNLTLATVRRWRRVGYGPRSVRLGRRDFYRENAVQQFLSEKLAEAEAAAEPRRRGRPRRVTLSN
jgi:hypothetical protein